MTGCQCETGNCQHWSSCAVHNEPAYPAGACDCGGFKGEGKMANMKSLDDVKADMSDLYEQVKNGQTDLKMASELANITGKYLKAVQLDLATEMFLSNSPDMRRIGHAAPTAIAT